MAIRIVRSVVLHLLLGLAACGGGQPEIPAGPPCEPSPSIDLRTEGFSFGTTCIAVPSGRAITGTLENVHVQPHNFAVYRKEPGADPQDLAPPNLLYRTSSVFQDESIPIELPPLEEGTYFFRCDFHPGEMTGRLVAG